MKKLVKVAKGSISVLAPPKIHSSSKKFKTSGPFAIHVELIENYNNWNVFELFYKKDSITS
jgi:hypothetical protein